MQDKLITLTNEELIDLFLKESHRFTSGIDDGLSFLELKEIRITLREIAVQLKSRQPSNGNGHGNGHGNGK